MSILNMALLSMTLTVASVAYEALRTKVECPGFVRETSEVVQMSTVKQGGLK